MSAYAELITAALGAVHALRSYQYGNASTELAEEVADNLHAAIRHSLEERDSDITASMKQIGDLQAVLDEIKAKLRERPSPTAPAAS